MNVLFIFCVILIPVFALFSVLTMNQGYNAMVRRRFDYLSEFPFEGYQTRHFDSHLAIGFFIAMTLMMAASSYLPSLASATVKGFIGSRPALIGVMGTLFPLSLIGLLFVGADKMKAHLGIFIGANGLFAIYAVSCGFLFLDMRQFNDTLGLTFAIIFFVLAVLGGMVMLNPKLASWGKLKKIGEGPNALYVRPRPFLLPFSEWIIIGLGVLTTILFSAGFYFLSSGI